MGFKSSSPAMAQSTRFKRKLSRNRNASFTPPAAPFNNTSFLIQLQQQRRHRQECMTSGAFDQYGSMQTYMSTIARRNHPMGFSTNSRPRPQHQAPISGSPPTSQKTSDPEYGKVSDPDGSHMCGSGPRELKSRSDGGARPVSARSPKLEGEEGEPGKQSHRHCRCFMNDNVDTQQGDAHDV